MTEVRPNARPTIDFSWMAHNIPSNMASRGVTQWKRLLHQKLTDAYPLTTPTGQPLRVAAFLEVASCRLATADSVSAYSREGLNPYHAFAAAWFAIPLEDVKRNTQRWRFALGDAPHKLHQELLQQLQILTDLQQDYPKRLVLDVEGNSVKTIQKIFSTRRDNETGTFTSLADKMSGQMKRFQHLASLGDIDGSFTAYLSIIQKAYNTNEQRETRIRRRFNRMAEADPTLFAIVPRMGLGHAALADVMREDGFVISEMEDVSYHSSKPFSKPEFVTTVIELTRQKGDLSRIGNLTLWQAYICDTVEPIIAVHVINPFAPDVAEQFNRLHTLIKDDVIKHIQTTEDIASWKDTVHQQIHNGHNLLEAHFAFIGKDSLSSYITP